MYITQWLNDWGILILAIAAFTAPYLITIALKKLYSPKLNIEFKNEPPYCRPGKDKKLYWCHFVIFNNGLSQADDCEAVLERIWKNKKEENDFIPSNLKWSTEDKKDFERACFKTIYPGERRYFCDIARVNKNDNKDNKFKFELSRPLCSQENYLPLGKHKIQISIYSKNITRIFFRKKAILTRQFTIDWKEGWKKIDWKEEWKNIQSEVQKCLEIEMLCKNQ